MLRGKLAFFTQNSATLYKNRIITLVFKKNANFFAESWQKSLKLMILTLTPKITFARRQKDFFLNLSPCTLAGFDLTTHNFGDRGDSIMPRHQGRRNKIRSGMAMVKGPYLSENKYLILKSTCVDFFQQIGFTR
jgi:hypothetical protein